MIGKKHRKKESMLQRWLVRSYRKYLKSRGYHTLCPGWDIDQSLIGKDRIHKIENDLSYIEEVLKQYHTHPAKALTRMRTHLGVVMHRVPKKEKNKHVKSSTKKYHNASNRPI